MKKGGEKDQKEGKQVMEKDEDVSLKRQSLTTRCMQHGFTQIVSGQDDLRRVQEYVATGIDGRAH